MAAESGDVEVTAEEEEAGLVAPPSPPTGLAWDAPQADALEQAQPVGERRRVVGSRPVRGEVPEADWLEQSVVEPFDDEDR